MILQMPMSHPMSHQYVILTGNERHEATRTKRCDRHPDQAKCRADLRKRGERADESAYRPGSVACTLRHKRATIHLRLPLPTASSGLPAGSGGPPSNACAVTPSRNPNATS